MSVRPASTEDFPSGNIMRAPYFPEINDSDTFVSRDNRIYRSSQNQTKSTNIIKTKVVLAMHFCLFRELKSIYSLGSKISLNNFRILLYDKIELFFLPYINQIIHLSLNTIIKARKIKILQYCYRLLL